MSNKNYKITTTNQKSVKDKQSVKDNEYIDHNQIINTKNIKEIKEKLINETYILLTLEEKIEMFYDIQKELQLRYDWLTTKIKDKNEWESYEIWDNDLELKSAADYVLNDQIKLIINEKKNNIFKKYFLNILPDDIIIIILEYYQYYGNDHDEYYDVFNIYNPKTELNFDRIQNEEFKSVFLMKYKLQIKKENNYNYPTFPINILNEIKLVQPEINKGVAKNYIPLWKCDDYDFDTDYDGLDEYYDDNNYDGLDEYYDDNNYNFRGLW